MDADFFCSFGGFAVFVIVCIAPYYMAKHANSHPQPKRKRTPQDECDDRFWDTIAVIDAIDSDWD